MSQASLTAAEPGRWSVSGALDFTTVTRLASEGRHLLGRTREGQVIEVDLSEVEQANSAGLALLLEWLEVSGARGIRLEYAHMPHSLERIAAFSNLQDILPAAA